MFVTLTFLYLDIFLSRIFISHKNYRRIKDFKILFFDILNHYICINN